jgi:hypothetical protein
MTTPYTTLWPIVSLGYGAYLGDLFTSLRRGGKSEDNALRIVAWLIENDKEIKPSIPSGSKPRPVGVNGLDIDFPNGTSLPAGVFWIPRVFIPNLPDEPAVATATVTIEEQWIKRLAEKLRRDRAREIMKRKAFYRRLFKRAFGLSAVKFDNVVWPAALKAPGVEPPRAGAPTKKK